MLRRKLLMLFFLFLENLGLFILGVDRFVFFIFWDVNIFGNVLDRWVGRMVIRFCCKLFYEYV